MGVIALAAVMGACGSTGADAPSSPTAPAAPTALAPSSFPSLAGRWSTRIAVSLRDRDSGSEFARFSCGGNLGVTAQNGGQFSGWITVPGSSPDTDRFCDRRDFRSGDVDGNGGVTVRLGTTALPGCTYVSGDSSLFTGPFTTQEVVLQSTELVTCEWPPPYQRPPLTAPLHIYNAERTETLTLTFAAPL